MEPGGFLLTPHSKVGPDAVLLLPLRGPAGGFWFALWDVLRCCVGGFLYGLIPGNIQDQVGQGSEQPDLVSGVPARCGGVGLDDL